MSNLFFPISGTLTREIAFTEDLMDGRGCFYYNNKTIVAGVCPEDVRNALTRNSVFFLQVNADNKWAFSLCKQFKNKRNCDCPRIKHQSRNNSVCYLGSKRRTMIEGGDRCGRIFWPGNGFEAHHRFFTVNLELESPSRTFFLKDQNVFTHMGDKRT